METSRNNLAVSITTRNRPAALRRCLESLVGLAHCIDRIVVVDDGSDSPVETWVRACLPPALAARLLVLRQDKNEGYIVGRNRATLLSQAPFVLNLDDDALVWKAEEIEQALGVLSSDARLAAVALAQADEAGRLWPAYQQPAPANYPCYVPSFIGYGHLLRTDIFRSLGGYREIFHFYGEEKEYCWRVWEAGYRVVYLPDARVCHLADRAGRDSQKYLRHVARNDCLGTLYNVPWPMLPFVLGYRVWAYWRMRRGWGIEDPGGFRWLMTELLRHAPRVWEERKAIHWATIARLRQMRKTWPAYRGALAN